VGAFVFWSADVENRPAHGRQVSAAPSRALAPALAILPSQYSSSSSCVDCETVRTISTTATATTSLLNLEDSMSRNDCRATPVGTPANSQILLQMKEFWAKDRMRRAAIASRRLATVSFESMITCSCTTNDFTRLSVGRN